MKNKILYNYFFILFAIIPISILVGSAVSSINIIIISLSFLIYAFYLKDWKWLKNKNIKLLFILYFYLIFNSFISLDFNIGIRRNFGFIQYILFFAAFNYFFFKYEKFNRIFYVWFVVILIVVLDVYVESFTGRNMIGNYSNTLHVHDRVFSFFKDEPKVGGYINCFFLLLTGYFLNIQKFHSSRMKYLAILITTIFFISIIFTGERSNTIRALFAFFIFFTLSKSFSRKEKIISITTVILFFGIIYSNFNFIKYRYGDLIFKNLSSIGIVIEHIKKTNFKPNNTSQTKISKEEHNQFSRSVGANYIKLYISSLKVFSNYPLFGSGNKNYRVVTCTKYLSDKIGVYHQFYKFNHSKEYELYNEEYVCNTHPHQIYFEFLSEHGIIGTVILLFVFFTLIYQVLREIRSNKNNLQLASLVYVILVFLPLLPSGAFFNNYMATLIWINLSIMMASSKSLNIFR